MALANGIILNTNTTLATVPAGQTWASVAILLCNFDTSGTAADEAITIYFVPSGGSVGNQTTVAVNLPIATGETFIFDSKMILSSGATVVLVGSVGSKVSATMSYMSI